MIQPSVGRKVWYYQSSSDAMNPNVQPRDATIVYVISDRLVNLRVSDTQGDTMPKLAVQLYQGEDDEPKSEFACWMPYQSQQAKKAETPTNFGERISALEVQNEILVKSINELQASLRAKTQPDNITKQPESSALNLGAAVVAAGEPPLINVPSQATIAKTPPQITK